MLVGAVERLSAALLVQGVSVAAVMESQDLQEATMVFRELQTQVVAVAVVTTMAAQAVQALSFFVTPVQFNILLAAQ
jgi:hypothetical protein